MLLSINVVDNLIIPLFCSLIIMIVIFILSSIFTQGRGILFTATQNYGPDDFRTLYMMESCIANILTDEGILYRELHVTHDVGNNYTCYFTDDKYMQHQMSLISDGWNISYSIDNKPFKRYSV